MAYAIDPLFSARAIVILSFILVACESFIEAIGLCQFKALFQNSSHTVEGLSSSGYETWIEWNQHLYLPENKTKMTWENADLECKRRHQDAHLVYIESKEGNEFVFSLASLYDDKCWIGLSDEDEEGFWKWGKKNAADYIDWGVSEPNGGINENCGGVFLPDIQWFDISCASDLYFLCERSLVTT